MLVVIKLCLDIMPYHYRIGSEKEGARGAKAPPVFTVTP